MMRSSRRMTLSRVFVLPRMLMRSKRDELALLDLEDDVDGARLLVDGRRGRGVDVGVALVLVVVGELLQVVGQLRAVEDLARLDRHAREEELLRLEQVARDVDLAQRVLRALVDRDRDVHRLLVGRQLDERVRDLDLDVAVVPVVGLDEQQVALEDVLAVGARRRQDRQQAPLARHDDVAQLGVGDGVVAHEVHAPHLDLGVLAHAEPDVDLGGAVPLAART